MLLFIVYRYAVRRYCGAVFCAFILALGPQTVLAQAPTVPPGLLGLSQPFSLPCAAGLSIDAHNPCKLTFAIDVGNIALDEARLRDASGQLAKYFLTALTVPDADLWVNLSPYEKDRISADTLAQTDLGRDLIDDDYLLKQLTASLTYPETQAGKGYWEEINSETRSVASLQQKQSSGGRDATPGVSKQSTQSFQKVWITAGKIHIYEDGTRVYIGEARLKVMMEEDYAAQQISNLRGSNMKFTSNPGGSQSAQAFKQHILPLIEKEVNEGKHFARLRRIYYAVILAAWYKEKLKDTVLNQAYFGQNRLKGVDGVSLAQRDRIYRRYLDSFQKGVYDYVKKEFPLTPSLAKRGNAVAGGVGGAAPFMKKIIRRRYVCGGIVPTVDLRRAERTRGMPPAVLRCARADVVLYPFMTAPANISAGDMTEEVHPEFTRFMESRFEEYRKVVGPQREWLSEREVIAAVVRLGQSGGLNDGQLLDILAALRSELKIPDDIDILFTGTQPGEMLYWDEQHNRCAAAHFSARPVAGKRRIHISPAFLAGMAQTLDGRIALAKGLVRHELEHLASGRHAFLEIPLKKTIIRARQIDLAAPPFGGSLPATPVDANPEFLEERFEVRQSPFAAAIILPPMLVTKFAVELRSVIGGEPHFSCSPKAWQIAELVLVTQLIKNAKIHLSLDDDDAALQGLFRMQVDLVQRTLEVSPDDWVRNINQLAQVLEVPNNLTVKDVDRFTQLLVSYKGKVITEVPTYLRRIDTEAEAFVTDFENTVLGLSPHKHFPSSWQTFGAVLDGLRSGISHAKLDSLIVEAARDLALQRAAVFDEDTVRFMATRARARLELALDLNLGLLREFFFVAREKLEDEGILTRKAYGLEPLRCRREMVGALAREMSWFNNISFGVPPAKGAVSMAGEIIDTIAKGEDRTELVDKAVEGMAKESARRGAYFDQEKTSGLFTEVIERAVYQWQRYRTAQGQARQANQARRELVDEFALAWERLSRGRETVTRAGDNAREFAEYVIAALADDALLDAPQLEGDIARWREVDPNTFLNVVPGALTRLLDHFEARTREMVEFETVLSAARGRGRGSHNLSAGDIGDPQHPGLTRHMQQWYARAGEAPASPAANGGVSWQNLRKNIQRTGWRGKLSPAARKIFHRLVTYDLEGFGFTTPRVVLAPSWR